ncbi:DNA-binding protein [Streptomyces caniscabiei]|uniref:DNA-binding protein n=1 Tax=Streptomyces caniscabiei TaxID=2746961 RepID=A0ABU4N2Q0_9ACTN|nr:DNA-binding protein [Streptomyces caniscabiei]MDX2948175.1 DNA-binding protein [Streptomyces caniscabiei]MDX3042793.1 DNA-binding protein [Streptomyces caniscabiei]
MSTSTAVRRKALSVAEALALPVMFDVWPTVGQALDIGRTATYQLARENALPIPCIRVGRQLRARRSDLLNFLGIREENGDGAGGPAPTPLAERTTESTGK